MTDEDPLWYKDAIIYQLHVKAFHDSNDDGVGDFLGLASKLDYIQDLGVSAIWLLPFYPSPLRDDGYDIADYRAINPAYGRMRDFRNLVREAHRRGLRVITELVINHTSDQHPWFQRAREARPGSARRNFYVWSDTDQRYLDTRIIFTDTETSNWAWDPVAQAYYWHRFFSHQPDLNFDNPRVVDAIVDVMRFWLDIGVDGMRLDAIPYLCEREGTNNENLAETHSVIKQLRAALDRSHPGRMFLAEANQWPEDVRPYFGDGDECHMAFHFPVMPRIYMALAQEDRHPITDIMRQTPEIPESCQWAIFLRNHDELTLEMVTDRERDYLWDFYAAERRMRINLGIRRRLAPLLHNDRRKIELLNSLLMSLPGTPIVYYGDELGMGDNVFLGDRDGVRTPMQWTPDRNGGFSRADPAALYLPPIMDAVYGYQAVNVEAQARNASSLLSWMKRLIAVRKAQISFGRGSLTFLYPGNRKVLAYLREYGGELILCVANLSGSPQPVELDLSAFDGRVPIELLGRSSFPPIGTLPYFITLHAYGFYWFVLTTEADAPRWHEVPPHVMPDFLTLVTPQGIRSLTAGNARETLAQRVLPEFLANQRWFAAKHLKISGSEIAAFVPVDSSDSWAFACFDVALSDGTRQRYALPLGLTWEQRRQDPAAQLLPHTLARVRRGPRPGVLHDALADPAFVRRLLRALAGGERIESPGGTLEFRPTNALSEHAIPEDVAVERFGGEQSNTSLLVGDAAVLKVYRRLSAGIHPEVEIGRFLTDVAAYRNTPPLLGTLALHAGEQEFAVALVQGFVRNQGDAWGWTEDFLNRLLTEVEVLPSEAAVDEARYAQYVHFARTLGERTAELHRAFAVETDDPAFRPEPTDARALAGWRRELLAEARKARKALRGAKRGLPDELAQPIRELQGRWRELKACIDGFLPKELDVKRTRYHGDFHLGQVIVVQDDAYIIDFEGEPARPLRERRQKHSPLKDVAGMLRSFDYAAWSAMQRWQETRPQSMGVPESWLAGWSRSAEAAFMAGYREAIGDCPSLPRSEREVAQLIDLFTLQKALYEIGYEAANRPRWLFIPVRGVLRILDRHKGAEG